MRRFGLGAIALILLNSTAGRAAAAAPSSCQVQQFAELQVVNPHGSPIVEVQLEGKPRLMMSDLGAGTSYLWREALPPLGLVTGNSEGYAYGVGGEAAVREITVGRMQVGPVLFRNQHFFVVGAPGGFTAGGRFAGLFGADFLAQADVQFDLPGKTIRLVRPVGCKGDQEVFWREAYSDAPISIETGPRYLTTVRVNDRPVLALIDTGADVSVLTPAVARRLGVPTEASQEKAFGIGGHALTTAVGRLQSFQIGDETIKTTRIQVADVFRRMVRDETGTRLGAYNDTVEMILGADFFRAHRVLLARSQNRMFFSYVGGPVFDVGARPPPSTAATSPPSGPPPSPTDAPRP